MEIKLKEASDETLKATWLDCLLRIDNEQKAIKIIQEELLSRQKPVAPAPAPVAT